MVVGFNDRATFMTLFDILLSLIAERSGVSIPTIDRIVEVLDDPNRLFAIKKASDEFQKEMRTSGRPERAAAKAIQEISRMSNTERQYLISVVYSLMGIYINQEFIKDLFKPIGTVALIKELTEVTLDLITYNIGIVRSGNNELELNFVAD